MSWLAISLLLAVLALHCSHLLMASLKSTCLSCLACLLRKRCTILLKMSLIGYYRDSEGIYHRQFGGPGSGPRSGQGKELPKDAVPLGKLNAETISKLKELQGSQVTVVTSHETPNYYRGVLLGAGAK